MAATTSIERKFELITRNLVSELGQTLFNEDAAKKLLHILEERAPKIYWGTAITGMPSFAYFVPLIKVRDFLHAGCKVTILLADVHAVLENCKNYKATKEVLEFRIQFYQQLLTAMLKSIDAPLENLQFVLGSSFQKSENYIMDLYTASTFVTQNNAKSASSDVVKSDSNDKRGVPLSALLYPILQVLDEQYLGCDIQFGGLDQRKIFALSHELLPHLGYSKRIHLMNPMLPSIGGKKGNKMSSSDPSSKIDLSDNAETIRVKINKSFAEEKNPDNVLIGIARSIIFPLEGKLSVDSKDFDGGVIEFKSIDEVTAMYKSGKLFPGDLKVAISSFVIRQVGRVQEVLATNKEFQLLRSRAYPS